MKGKIVVADASTLIGLSRIGQLNLLRDLYGKVVIPESVYDEVPAKLNIALNKLKPQNISRLRRLPTVGW